MKKITLILIVLFLIFVRTIAQVNLQNGLVAYYSFNGNSIDESGNNYNGVVNGAVLTTDRYGNANSAYSFDGIDDYIATNFSGILGSSPRTISLWLKAPSYTSVREALGYGGDEPGYGNSIRLGLNYNVQGPHINVSNAINEYNSDNDNEWHNYIWIVPAIANPRLTDVLVYKDGVNLTNITYWHGILNSMNATINTKMSQNVHIGHWGDINSGYNSFFLGEIDDVRIYNRALNNQEILALNNIITKLPEIQNDKTFFYPNPAENVIYMSLPNSVEAVAYIYNLAGKQLICRQITTKDYSMDISILMQGIYILKLVESNWVSINMLIKK
jgi:hypothetical protein